MSRLDPEYLPGAEIGLAVMEGVCLGAAFQLPQWGLAWRSEGELL